MNEQQMFQIGMQALRSGDAQAALRHATALLARFPNSVAGLALIAMAHMRLGNAPAAVVALRRAVQLSPSNSTLRGDLAEALVEINDPRGAIVQARKALSLDPKNTAARATLGMALFLTDQRIEALAELRLCRDQAPNDYAMIRNLGLVLQTCSQFSEALYHQRELVRRFPNHLLAKSLLGKLEFDSGHWENALPLLRGVADHNTPPVVSQADYLFALVHASDDPQLLLDEHCRVAASMIETSPPPTFDNTGNPQRRLKIGYLSSDFRDHPIGLFIQPLLERHDPTCFDVTCYSDVGKPDAVTKMLQAAPVRWVDVSEMGNDALAERIRGDSIDLLIDLTLFSNGGRRVPMLTRKPAPVIVNYLAYASTSGLPQIDWRLSDEHIDPPGPNDQFSTERIWRLPNTQWVYRAPTAAGNVAPLPADRHGFITFGSFAKLFKIGPEVIAQWSAVLSAAPTSRLRIQSRMLQDTGICEIVRERFVSAGIDGQRIEFHGDTTLDEYFRAFGEVDVLLDTFPFAGGTTTCNSLWMGVPVVARPGRTPASRVAASVLSNIGRAEWIANDADHFIKIAIDLIQDRAALRQIRSSLREQVRQSPLCDESGFVKEIEVAYRSMWVDWCSRPSELQSG